MFRVSSHIRRFGVNSLTKFFEESPFKKVIRNSEKQEQTFGLPWTFMGSEDQEYFSRYMSDRIFIQNRLDRQQTYEDFYEMFEKVMEAMNLMDITHIEDMFEKSLYSKLSNSINDLKMQGRTINAFKSDLFSDKLPEVKPIDGLVYRGVNINREKNKSTDSYHMYYDPDLGIICYTLLELSDPLAYVNQKAIEEMYEANRQTLIQLLIRIKSPWNIQIKEGDKLVSNDLGINTWAQNWQFESQCRQPEWMTNELKTENYMEWIAKFRPTEWIISDMNGFMNCNPLVREQAQVFDNFTKFGVMVQDIFESTLL